MGDLFDSLLKADESLFLNSQFLDIDYQPKLVPFRESQQQHIASCIKPLLQRRNAKNILIHGKPGVGKTVCLKHVLIELKDDYSDDVFCFYVNCWKKDTSFKVISSLCEQLNYSWVHNKTFDDLMKIVSELVNKKSAVIVLDEVDKLQDQNILYSLLEDVYRKSLVLITNDENFLVKLDSRVKSRLIPDVLEFKSYNYIETEQILKNRVEYAFIPNSMAKEVFDFVVKKTFEFGDMRSGLFLLRQSAENAESKSSRKILLDHVNQALSSLAVINFDSEDILLGILKENSGKSATEIYKVYEQKEGKSYKTFQRRLKDLEFKKFIKLKEENSGNGNHTVVDYINKM